MPIIETKLINRHSDVPARAIKIKHPKGSLETPVYAVNASEIDRKLITENDLRGIVELYLTLKPEQLKKISRNVDIQQQFEYRVNSYMRKTPSNQLIVAVPLLEGKQGYSPSISEAYFYGEYIAEIISNSRVDIVCSPIFNKVAEKHIDALVRKFLETMATYNVGVALSIPYASRETWEKLIEVYLSLLDINNNALLNFLCVDYNGSNPISKYMIHNYVLRYVAKLQGDTREHVIIYGTNVKYDRVARKYDELAARDLAAYFAQLDIFGGNHKRKYIPGEVAEKLKTKDPVRKQKILNRKRYMYVSLDKMIKEPELSAREVELLKRLIDEGYQRSYIEKISKLVNIRNILAETDVLRPLFSGRGWQHFNEPLQYLNSKEIVKIDNKLVKTLERFNKSIKSETKSLDEYT